MAIRTRSISIYVIVLLFVFGIITVSMRSESSKDTLISDFIKWENGEMSENDIPRVIENLERYLIKNPNASKNSIKEISERLSIIEVSGLRITEYIENPLFYGVSARRSFQIVQYGDSAKLIMSNGSIAIDGLRKFDDKNFILYGYDYKFSNVTGIIVAKITIDKNAIVLSKKMISSITELPPDFRFVGDSLYYRDVNIEFEDIDINSLNVHITANDNSGFYLYLNEDGTYHIQINQN